MGGTSDGDPPISRGDCSGEDPVGATGESAPDSPLEVDAIHHGDARELVPQLAPESVNLSLWSPPYPVTEWREDENTPNWNELIAEVLNLHERVVAPGGFVVVNIADILSYPDPEMPDIQLDNVSRKRVDVTTAEIEAVLEDHPDWDRHQLADHFGCSEQTIQRRLEDVNVRGGRHSTPTKVKPVAGLIEKWAEDAGFHLRDRRVWVKDPAWKNCPWHTQSYRSVDEFEYLFVLWKPGDTVYDRNRLRDSEWGEWGSRAVWEIGSVEANDEAPDHLKKFPPELARRVVRLFTDPGDLVVDPFCGSGTTCVQAATYERQYVGIDIDETAVTLARDNVMMGEDCRAVQSGLRDFGGGA